MHVQSQRAMPGTWRAPRRACAPTTASCALASRGCRRAVGSSDMETIERRQGGVLFAAPSRPGIGVAASPCALDQIARLVRAERLGDEHVEPGVHRALAILGPPEPGDRDEVRGAAEALADLAGHAEAVE